MSIRNPSIALVTGANKGIGLETVRRLVGADYRVYLTARNPKLGQAAADPGMTDTDLSHWQGHSVHDGTDAIVAYALDTTDGPSGTFRDRDGELPW